MHSDVSTNKYRSKSRRLIIPVSAKMIVKMVISVDLSIHSDQRFTPAKTIPVVLKIRLLHASFFLSFLAFATKKEILKLTKFLK